MTARTRIFILILLAAAAVAVIAAKRLAPTPSASAPAAPIAVVVELSSGQCPMCEEMSSLLGAMEREFAPRLHVMYIDALKDDDPRKKYGVNSLPAQVLLDATGVFLEKHEGVMTRGEILQQFGRHGIELLPATQGSRDDRR